ncbi:hypothetical protein, partial [Vibrio parahaemolyticus]|uniref:hypothetical protein n=1 Tax=Vibrio parahaemolyticus TaxID=670 RepID=UPI001ED9A41C
RIHFSSFPMSWDLEKVSTFFHFSDLSHFFNGFNHVNCRIHFSSFPMSWDLEKVSTFFHFSDLSHFFNGF